LKRKPDVERRRAPDISIKLGMRSHLHVSRKDRDQEGDDPDARKFLGLGNQQADTA